MLKQTSLEVTEASLLTLELALGILPELKPESS